MSITVLIFKALTRCSRPFIPISFEERFNVVSVYIQRKNTILLDVKICKKVNENY